MCKNDDFWSLKKMPVAMDTLHPLLPCKWGKLLLTDCKIVFHFFGRKFFRPKFQIPVKFEISNFRSKIWISDFPAILPENGRAKAKKIKRFFRLKKGQICLRQSWSFLMPFLTKVTLRRLLVGKLTKGRPNFSTENSPLANFKSNLTEKFGLSCRQERHTCTLVTCSLKSGPTIFSLGKSKRLNQGQPNLIYLNSPKANLGRIWQKFVKGKAKFPAPFGAGN